MNYKFSCPHCGRHLETDDSYAGTAATCPDCGKPITIEGPGKDFVFPERRPVRQKQAPEVQDVRIVSIHLSTFEILALMFQILLAAFLFAAIIAIVSYGVYYFFVARR